MEWERQEKAGVWLTKGTPKVGFGGSKTKLEAYGFVLGGKKSGSKAPALQTRRVKTRTLKSEGCGTQIRLDGSCVSHPPWLVALREGLKVDPIWGRSVRDTIWVFAYPYLFALLLMLLVALWIEALAGSRLE
jgi:hypothetical protein